MKRIIQTLRQTHIILRACFLMALLAIAGSHAFAQTNIDMNGMDANGTGYNYESGLLTISGNGPYIISGTNGRIVVTGDIVGVVNITLNSVNLSGDCAFEIGDNSDVLLTLVGTNTLHSGNGRAGLKTGGGSARLEITAASDAHSLTATSYMYGAGIGGNANSSGTNITISGGRVTATGGQFGGAGIGGGGGYYSGGGHGENITISGGTVTATGGEYGGAGIGGSTYGGNGENITISGGTVTATGGRGGYYGSDDGAGIGGGYSGSGGTITISGGTVTANSGARYGTIAAGIGGYGSNRSKGTLIITGGSVKMNNHVGPQPKNGAAGQNIYCNILQVGDPSVGDGISVTAGSISGVTCDATTPPATGAYGIKDVKTRDGGKVYFYLPETGVDELVTLTAGGGKYGKSYKRSTSHTSSVPPLDLLYGITLSKTETYNFPDASYGYGAQSALNVTVTNAGSNPTGVLNVALSGADFTLSKTSISDIAVGSEDSFTVTPNTGLTPGITYTATVTVSNSGNDIEASFDVSFTVNKKEITISGSGITATKVYNGNAGFSDTHINISGATLDGNQDGPDLTLDESGASGSFGTANVQSDNITFTGFALSGSAAGNYTLATQQTVLASIIRKPISVSDGMVTPKEYDGNKTATVTGLTFPDLVSLETFTAGDDYTVTAAYDEADADNGIAVKATIELKAAGPTSKNYTLDNGTDYPLTGNITPKPVSIDDGDITATKTYNRNAGFIDTHIDISGVTLNGNLDGPNLTLDKGGATGSFGTPDVQSGNIAFTGFDLDGSAAGNYTLTQPIVAASITRKKITVSGGAVTPKAYDGNKTATVTGLTFPDLESPETFTLDDDYTLTAAYDDAGADNGIAVKATIELKAAGPVSKNYTLTNGTDYPLTGDITQKAINITGGMATKIYDGTTAAKVSSLTFDVSLANSQLEIGNDYTVTGATYAGAGVGTGITVTADVTLNSPSKADNYVLLNGAGYNLTTGVITPNTPPVTDLAFTLDDLTYDGSAHPVTVTAGPGITGLGDILAVKYTGTAGTDYPASTTAPVKAGAYTVTVDIAEGTNYAAITGLVIGSFTILKAEPTPAVLAFTLGDVACTGSPRPVPVTPAKDIEGLGDITVYYNGSTTVPVDPGEYAVTVDIAEGANYAAVTGLPLGAFTIQEPPIPVPTHFRVLLPSAAGLTTDPPAGTYSVSRGANFTFTLTPDVPSADGTPPQVQTNRRTPDQPNASGIRITPNADESYTVVIIGIRQDIEIDLSVAGSKSDPTDNASVADADALKVNPAPGALVIANSRPGAATVYVYNLAGTLVRLTTVPPGTMRLTVPPGIYIVTDGSAFRCKTVVVR